MSAPNAISSINPTLKLRGLPKKDLHLYVCLDVDATIQDTDMILRCIRVFIAVNKPQFNIVSFKEISIDKFTPLQETQNDIIQRGMTSLCNMFTKLKLKTKDNVWFIYVSTGRIKMIDSDVTIVLLNKNPGVKECYYTIHKNRLDVHKNKSKEEKLQNLQVIKRSLDELFSTTKTIRYNNVDATS